MKVFATFKERRNVDVKPSVFLEALKATYLRAIGIEQGSYINHKNVWEYDEGSHRGTSQGRPASEDEMRFLTALALIEATIEEVGIE